MSDHARRFYVYAYWIDGKLRYIGKGSRDRIYDHVTRARAILRRWSFGERAKASRFHLMLAAAMRDGLSVFRAKLAEGLSERTALELEIHLIAKAKPGSLWNVASGGEGLTSDAAMVVNRDPEKRAFASSKIKNVLAMPDTKLRHKKAIWEANKRPETKKARSDAAKAKWADPEYREHMREAHRKRWAKVSPEVRSEAARIAQRGRRPARP